MNDWPLDLRAVTFYLVGIKGTGMCAFAELLQSRGASVSGSDVSDEFYTDAILRDLHIPFFQGFNKTNVPEKVDIVVHSAAYDPDKHVELVEARRLGHRIIVYTEALGDFSSSTDSSAVAGVHGKTTTTAMVGTLVKLLGLKGSVLVGSGVSTFGGHSTLCEGTDFFVAETCEYRKHFLHFHPRRAIVTSVESDHQDFFPAYEDMLAAFVEFAMKLPEGGSLIYCADDAGADELAGIVSKQRKDLALVAYGFKAEGPWQIHDHRVENSVQKFRINAFRSQDGGHEEFRLRIPGTHNIRNATAALALMASIYIDHYGSLSPKIVGAMAQSLENFAGCTRRSEILGEHGGVLFLDDYAHHPTAIRTTLAGYREFYPKRRIVLSFMSHTYSRTAALLDDFAAAFGSADVVFLHEIYASARESYSGSVNGEMLAQRAAVHHRAVEYRAKHADCIEELTDFLKPGDVFVSMGAGDNWKLSHALCKVFENKEAR